MNCVGQNLKKKTARDDEMGQDELLDAPFKQTADVPESTIAASKAGQDIQNREAVLFG